MKFIPSLPSFLPLRSLPAAALSVFAALAVLSLLGAARQAAAEPSPLDPEKSRWTEVRKDDLRETIAPADLQVVVLMPVADCTGPNTGNRIVVRKWHCAGMMRMGAEPALSGVNYVIVPEDLASPSVAETVRRLPEVGVSAGPRYVLLIDWQIALREAGGSYFHMSLAAESVLYDRRDQRWRWQAIHRYERYTGDKMKPEDVVRDLGYLFKDEVLRPVLNRPAVLSPAPQYAMSWATPDEALQAPAADRARVLLFNDYGKVGKSYEYTPDHFQLLADADVTDAKARYKSPSAVNLVVGTRSYLAFDVKPGDYSLFVGVDGRTPLKLQAGQTTYVRYYRGMFNANGVELVNAADAAALKAKGKHAVLEDHAEPKYAHTPVRFLRD